MLKVYWYKLRHGLYRLKHLLIGILGCFCAILLMSHNVAAVQGFQTSSHNVNYIDSKGNILYTGYDYGDYTFTDSGYPNSIARLDVETFESMPANTELTAIMQLGFDDFTTGMRMLDLPKIISNGAATGFDVFVANSNSNYTKCSRSAEGYNCAGEFYRNYVFIKVNFVLNSSSNVVIFGNPVAYPENGVKVTYHNLIRVVGKIDENDNQAIIDAINSLKAEQNSTNNKLDQNNQAIKDQTAQDKEHYDKEDNAASNIENQQQQNIDTGNGTTILNAAKNIGSTLINSPATTCGIPMNFGHLDLGVVDVCNVPDFARQLCQLVMHGGFIIFCFYSLKTMINTMIKLFSYFRNE